MGKGLTASARGEFAAARGLAPDSEVETCLRGEAIYGDSFGQVEIARWYAEEREAYANLGAGDRSRYAYRYHALNVCHGYGHLPVGRRFQRVLSVGGAYGDELLPIADRMDEVTIVEPSESFEGSTRLKVPVTRVKPAASGVMPFPSGRFDLITCLGVLHHIPNVSFVLRELARVLAPEGFLLLREPTVSMGDWRQVRGNLTRHERGLHLPLLRRAIGEAGLHVDREARVVFPAWSRVCERLGTAPFNVKWATRVDQFLCRAFSWNSIYHATTFVQKLRPAAVYFVLRRPSDARISRCG